MKQSTITIILILVIASLQAQDNNLSYKFRLYLNDKGNSEYKLNEPEQFLSKQSIERKKRQGVSIDERDLPISADYFHKISKSGGKVVSFSKWFNSIVVQLNDSSQIDNFTNLSFVDSAKYVWSGNDVEMKQRVRPRLDFLPQIEDINTDCINGLTEKQFVLHNAKNIYKTGYSGIGINIAVIDAGFTNVDVIPYFALNNIVEFRGFVPGGNVLVDSDHGTKVFSTISAVVPGQMMGSAPSANFYLLHTEDVLSEFPVEEDYWVRAVEYADSVGVDVINSSLGYTNFEDQQLSYSHASIDGRTSIMSLAADLAYDKGMIVVTSAGNEGNKDWEKISVPGDAFKALTVGAVDSDGDIASFSSKGLTADGRIKPDVVSVGKGAITIGDNGTMRYTNGTSFSSPFMAGLVATLWSINPEIDRCSLLNIIKESSDRFQNPDSVYGNGITDIDVAMVKVLNSLPILKGKYNDDIFSVVKMSDDNLEIELKIEDCSLNNYYLDILDESGVVVFKKILSDNKQIIEISDVLRKNKYNSIFILLTTPNYQKTVRLKV